MSHLWLRGGRRATRAAAFRTLERPPVMVTGGPLDAHRRNRGPYTAMGSLVRSLVSDGLPASLVDRHLIEILTVAPEVRDQIDGDRDTLTSVAIPTERTRFYSRYRTLRIAHGLTELVSGAVESRGEPVSLIIDDLNNADPTDAEALAVMLRRLPPDLVTIVAGSSNADLPGELSAALTQWATVVPLAGPPEPVAQCPGDAARFVAGDGVSDDPGELAAYAALEPAERASLHDARFAELVARQEFSLSLGAIPFHGERGSDPAGRGADALREALDYCINTGFYDATVDLGVRGRAVIDWREQGDHWWAFTTKMTTSLAALSRAEEAETLYREARAFTTSPAIHLQAAYATAMLYTRHHAESKKDNELATGWINQAIAFAEQIADPKIRAFEAVFQRNGLALILAHQGKHAEALRLVDEGMRRLDRELEPDEHRLHRSVLRYNRGQVHLAMRNLEAALADYSAVIEIDPNYSEYYFDRGNLLRRMGRFDQARDDYDRAIRLSPPFPEVYYNRADLALEMGDTDSALTDLDYVLDLQPDYLDALVNRAGLRVQLGDFAGATRDATAGLAIDDGDAYLHCVLGQIAAADGDHDEALAQFDAAVTAQPGMSAALAGRAAVRFDTGDANGAVTDLGLALQTGESPELLFNRAAALRAAGRPQEAYADLRRARELDPDDPDILAATAELTQEAVTSA